jgi:GT2 family glycosyltransferase
MAAHLKYIVVLVNYNNWQDTAECVASLRNAGISDSSVLIVENSSPNESYKELREKLPEINIIRNEKNLGFSGGNNLGIRYATEKSAEYVILLNNDTLVEPDAIRTLIDEMDIHKDAALGTGQIRYYPEKNKIWYAGGKLIPWRGLAIHLERDKVVNDRKKENKPFHVSFISGCYLCIRNSELTKLGLLEEKFFIYLEDIEYSARAVRRNMKLLYVPDSIIYHKCRGDRQLKEQSLYYAVRNRNLLIDLSFPVIAKVYFFLVIVMKMVFWFFADRKLFVAAREGMNDYRNNIFGRHE